VCFPSPSAPLSPDLLLVAIVTRQLGDRDASVYWLSCAVKTLTKALGERPFGYEQTMAIFGHVFTQCVEQGAFDTATEAFTEMETFILKSKGDAHSDLRCGARC
jgi:hypothetical protein